MAVLLQQSPHSIEMRRVPSSLPVQGGDPRRITTMELLHNTEDMHNYNAYHNLYERSCIIPVSVITPRVTTSSCLEKG